MRALGMFTAAALVFGARTGLDAWAVQSMWNWFIAPLGVPALGYLHAMGLDLMIGMIVSFSATQRTGPERTLAETLSFSAGKGVAIAVVVLCGWIVQGAM